MSKQDLHNIAIFREKVDGESQDRIILAIQTDRAFMVDSKTGESELLATTHGNQTIRFKLADGTEEDFTVSVNIYRKKPESELTGEQIQARNARKAELRLKFGGTKNVPTIL